MITPLNSQDSLILPEERARLEEAKTAISRNEWVIADTALGVMQRFRAYREREATAGRTVPIFEMDVWREIGRLVNLSGNRVQLYARVAECFPPAERAPAEEIYDFGYFEKTLVLPTDQDRYAAMAYLAQYESGELGYGGERPAMNEFIYLYQQHYAGKHLGTPSAVNADAYDPDPTPAPLQPVEPPEAWQDLLAASQKLLRDLARLSGEDRPAVRQLKNYLLKVLETIPEAMRQAGWAVPLEENHAGK